MRKPRGDACGDPVSSAPGMHRTAVSTSPSTRHTASGSAASETPWAARAVPGTAPGRAAGSAGLAHGVSLAADADAVWRVLGDVETAVRCMPGAELTGPPEASPLGFRMATAIGPMRATFEGTATLAYDENARAGSMEGEGRDSRSRSTGRGRIEFAISPSGNGCDLTLSLLYSIEGPLAQFSRGAVVDAVVEALVERFAANVAAAASGEPVADAAPAGGLGLALAGLWKRLKRWLSG